MALRNPPGPMGCGRPRRNRTALALFGEEVAHHDVPVVFDRVLAGWNAVDTGSLPPGTGAQKILMSKILLGTDPRGKNVTLDLDVLLGTRLLLQANSGKGKSWLLRRLAEQLFGKVQVIIIDPEGEFATLREKFDYVLVGKGGETAAHPRIAGLTAQRLLELRASAVVDLYEMKPSERHAYVKAFLDALVDAPKNLWHPVVVIVDEAHIFCPEKGAGESEASDAFISLATRGRKRGYCLVAATQRLGKLRKDAASELNNVVIGGTFIDIDRKRAADALGVYGPEVHPFFNEIRLLEKGKFYFLGPAVATEKVLVTVGPVETTHPQAGSSRHAAEAPPTPDKIKALLPRLADLPKEAEEKAKSIADLQQQVRELKAELKKRPTEIQERVQEKIVEIPAVSPDMVHHLACSIKQIEAASGAIATALATIRKAPPVRPAPVLKAVFPQKASARDTVIAPSGDLKGPEKKILRALSELLSIGKDQPGKNMVAAWAGYSPVGGAFGNPIGSLRSKGLIDYPQAGVVMLTDSGREVAPACEAPDQEEIWSRIERTCTGPEQKILRALLDNAGQDEISKEELAAHADYSPIGGAFGNPIGKLRTKGLLDYPKQGVVKAADWLFLEN